MEFEFFTKDNARTLRRETCAVKCCQFMAVFLDKNCSHEKSFMKCVIN